MRLGSKWVNSIFNLIVSFYYKQLNVVTQMKYSNVPICTLIEIEQTQELLTGSIIIIRWYSTSKVNLIMMNRFCKELLNLECFDVYNKLNNRPFKTITKYISFFNELLFVSGLRLWKVYIYITIVVESLWTTRRHIRISVL